MLQCRGFFPRFSSYFSSFKSLTPLILFLLFILLFSQLTSAADLKLAWAPDASSDAAGYKIYYGTASKVYETAVNVGNVTSYTLQGLSPGQVYYVAAVAYDNYGYESDYSNEVSQVVLESTTSVVINVTTSPPDLPLIVDGVAVTSPQTFSWEVGSLHNLSIPSPQIGTSGVRYIYSSWSDGAAQTHQITVPSTTATYTAGFITQYSLTTSVSPTGAGSVTPSGINWYDSGQSLALSATANPGYSFSGWSGDFSGANESTSMTVTGPKSLTANFTLNKYALTVSANPSGSGSIIKNPDKAAYLYGDQVTLMATPASGYVFKGWSGNAGGLTNPLTIMINDNTSVTAKFLMPGTLSVTSDAAFITSGRHDGPIFKFLRYPSARGGPFSPSSVTYTLKNTGQTPINWHAYNTRGWVSLSSVSGSLEPGAITPVTVSINSYSNNLNVGSYSDTVTFINTTTGYGNTSRSVALTITAPLQSFTVTTNPIGLTLLVDGVAVASPHTFSWEVGSSHTLSVPTPKSRTFGVRYVYSSWSDGGAQSHQITVPSGSTNYTASFITQYSLTTSASPSRTGSVTPSGTNWYHKGQSLSLSATPHSGYGFSRWAGSLSAKGSQIFITMNSPQKVQAYFSPVRYTQPIRFGSPPGDNAVKVDLTQNGNNPLLVTQSLNNSRWSIAPSLTTISVSGDSLQEGVDPIKKVFRSFYLGVNDEAPYSSSREEMTMVDNVKGISPDTEITTFVKTGITDRPNDMEIGLALKMAEGMNNSLLNGVFTVIRYVPDGIGRNSEDPVTKIYEFDFDGRGVVTIKQLQNIQGDPEGEFKKSYSIESNGSLTIGEISGQVKKDGEVMVMMDLSQSGSSRPNIFIGVKRGDGHSRESLKGEYVDVMLAYKNVGTTKEGIITEGLVRFDGAGDCYWTPGSGFTGPQTIIPGVYSVSTDGEVKAFGMDGLMSSGGDFIVLINADDAVGNPSASSDLRMLVKRPQRYN